MISQDREHTAGPRGGTAIHSNLASRSGLPQLCHAVEHFALLLTTSSDTRTSPRQLAWPP
ncbi:hypothetical protein E2C01_068501 [Portunus trituberculatus]|uniref:Uncharacterized protein n=1 Tax=Portunus trituberculatus TaxID=210409 RepID=A0A5B7HW19_PORTR|nr:hypothetical protein [Portunus trituberculatus]